MEKDLGAEFIAIAHRFKRVSINSMFPDLSKGEFWVLKMLHVNCLKNEGDKGVYVSKIAAHLKVTPSAISRMLRGLEEKGLIERSVDKNDRRNTYVFLTEKGDKAREKIEDHMNEFAKRVIATMGEDDSKMLINLCNKLIDTMEVEMVKYKEEHQL